MCIAEKTLDGTNSTRKCMQCGTKEGLIFRTIDSSERSLCQRCDTVLGKMPPELMRLAYKASQTRFAWEDAKEVTESLFVIASNANDEFVDALAAGIRNDAVVIPEEAKVPDRNLFDEWANLNQIISPDRSRFDVMKSELPKCTTRAEAMALLFAEGYAERYPLLPDWLK
jgi:hypothetical protein